MTRCNNARAVGYTRSSKDRNDVSPAAQRHAMAELARSRSLEIVETFDDPVEYGATEDRPGWQALKRAIEDPSRTWATLLIYDSSRIARRRHIAQGFKHELKRRGIKLIFVTRPIDVDPISEIWLESTSEAQDEVWSLMCREKGLAGMRENVRRGFRAGGRAPIGYRLAQIPTGAIREGKPVTKSKLEPSECARAIASYLKARALRVPRVVAMRESGIEMAENSLVGVEWNALTYAGHTVWNVHREPGTGSKRRPRDEWEIHRDTHPALITDLEAETILSNLENGDMRAALRAARAAGSRFLLSGLLYSTDGRTWDGHGSHYRLRRAGELPGRIVPTAEVDQAVTETLRAFRTSDEYVGWLHAGQQRAERKGGPGADILARIRKLERERLRAAEAHVSSDGGGVYGALVEKLTRQIEALRHEFAAVERAASNRDGLHKLSVSQLRALIESQDPSKVVRSIVDRVILEPDLACQVRLRSTAYNETWAGVASPGRYEAQTQALVLPVALRKRA